MRYLSSPSAEELLRVSSFDPQSRGWYETIELPEAPTVTECISCSLKTEFRFITINLTFTWVSGH